MTPATHKRNSVGQALCKGKGAPNLTDSTYNVTCKLCLKKIEELTKKTIKKIEDKVNWVGRHNMPTTTEIAEMLEFLHIPFTTAPCPKPPKGRKPGMKLNLVRELFYNKNRICQR